MFGLSYIKLIGIGVAALMLVLLVADRSRWMHRAHGAEAQVTAACDATRLASNRPKLDCKQIPQQIQFLGDALNDVKAKTEAAQAADLAHAQQVESRQNIASQETASGLQAQLTVARARADALGQRLRDERTAAANQGSSRAANLPSLTNPASGATCTAEDYGLSVNERLIATEQAIRLRGWQDWWATQSNLVR